MVLSSAGAGGLTGWVLDVVAALGSVGVGLMVLLESLFPPIPSEVVLPLAGYQANRGEVSLAGVLVASTVGSVVGALLLYGLARRLGEQRATDLLARLPLLDHDDVEEASAWFRRHGRAAVFTGRLIPGARSLVSLPAGAARMPLGTFIVLTTAGSAIWNSLLIGLGWLLGTQYELVQRYASVLDYLVLAALVVCLALLVRRRLRKRRTVSTASARGNVRPTPGERDDDADHR